ncbi:AraC family transcriptional regulator [Sediminitomix flava]|uniref:AraC family transcriptional regulator n=2 Tax=Sediminitomix flava TaxID=379075 RepID=A0A315ZGZ4_SEDFL|nr:AraC family transcriptional regulator [Sediminitomix flava]
MEQIATQLDSSLEDENYLEINEKFGKGSVWRIELEEGLILQREDLCMNDDLYLIRDLEDKNVESFSFIYQLSSFHLDGQVEENEKVGETRNTTFIFNNRFKFNVRIPAHTQMNHLHIYMTKEWIEKFIASYNIPKSSDLLRLLNDPDVTIYDEIGPELLRVVHQMLSYEPIEKLKKAYLKIKVEESFVVAIDMNWKREENFGELSYVHQADFQVVTSIKKDLLDNLISPPSLEEFADRYSMSKSKIQNLFKQVYGSPVFQYLKKIRLEKAMEMLQNQNISISEIGYLVGYTSLGHFSKAFKEFHGILPKDVRKQNIES